RRPCHVGFFDSSSAQPFLAGPADHCRRLFDLELLPQQSRAAGKVRLSDPAAFRDFAESRPGSERFRKQSVPRAVASGHDSQAISTASGSERPRSMIEKTGPRSLPLAVLIRTTMFKRLGTLLLGIGLIVIGALFFFAPTQAMAVQWLMQLWPVTLILAGLRPAAGVPARRHPPPARRRDDDCGDRRDSAFSQSARPQFIDSDSGQILVLDFAGLHRGTAVEAIYPPNRRRRPPERLLAGRHRGHDLDRWRRTGGEFRHPERPGRIKSAAGQFWRRRLRLRQSAFR